MVAEPMGRFEFTAYLARLAKRMAMSPEDEAAFLEQRRRAEEEQRSADLRRRLSCLSPRHLEYARALESGEHKPSEAWKVLTAALTDAPGASVLLCGPTGVGKTTAATRWAYRAAQRGSTVLHCPAARWPDLARHEEALEEAQETGLLIIDQLHRCEELPAWIVTPIRELIDHRYERRRQTIGLYTGATGPGAMADAMRVLRPEITERLGGAKVVGGQSYRRTW